MIIGRVVGEVVCTVKFPKYDRQKLLQVQPLDLDRQPKGGPMTAIDLVDAGPGDDVLVCLEGQSAVDAIGLGPNPVDAVILGVVDAVSFVPSRKGNAWTKG
ncbi:MAG: EutN/CcmL family microcompartment protein [Acidobacteria bacterium]|nr:EutN/CcmL family microcompartment protein [Acidobacteriota bacterium]